MLRCALLIVLTLLVAWNRPAVAGQTAPAGTGAPCASESAGSPSYRLRVGDVLDIQFRFTPEFNASPAVRPDGRIAMSGVGELAVEHLTTAQLTCALKQAYAGILRDPVISVSVRNFENPFFVVGGEVERPGKYELRSDTTITKAIAIAGGFKRSARQQVVLFRQASPGGNPEPRELDVKAILEKGRIADDILLERDDMVFVPQSGFSKIERFIPIPGVGLFVPVP
jgi:polysaccharide export outer membrane protein